MDKAKWGIGLAVVAVVFLLGFVIGNLTDSLIQFSLFPSDTITIQFPEWYKFAGSKGTVIKDLTPKQFLSEPSDTISTNSVSQLNTNANNSLKPPADSCTHGIYCIEQPEALDDFFFSIEKLRFDSLLVRIAHIGDSQIEGDRITNYLRKYLQQKFGGNGLGYIPPIEPTSHHALKRYHSENWKRYAIFNERYRPKSNPTFGNYFLGGCIFRFATSDKEPTQAILQLEHHYKPVPFDTLKLLWGNCEKKCKLSVYQNDSIASQFFLQSVDSFVQTGIPILHHKPIKFVFEGYQSPTIYGFLLDGTKGIQVDNYAIRGHAGQGYKYMNFDFVARQLNNLNTKLLIFQYGGNIVTSTAESYRWLEEDIYRMLMRFKAAAPKTSILVISIADQAKLENGEIRSNSNIKRIREAQRIAAKRANVAFWDLYEAMGGENSAINWATQNPPLMSSDYTHFSVQGQQLVGKMIYEVLLKAYQDFQARKIISQ